MNIPMNVDRFVSRLVSRTGVLAAVVALFALGLSQEARAQKDFPSKWLDVGAAAQLYSAQGARFGGGGWEYPYVLYGTGNLDAVHDAYHTWIGIKDFKAPDGETYPYWINYFCNAGDECSGDDVFNQKFLTVSKYPKPDVTVDGLETYRSFVNVDKVDPSMSADRKIVHTIATTSGITMHREIKQFSQQFHDNYHIIEYTFTNTGDVDGDGEQEINRPVDGVYFYTDKRWGANQEASDIMSRGTKWGKYEIHDMVRDGDANLRAQFSWAGYPQSPASTWDVLGGPSVSGGGNGWPDAVDTTGRLTGWQFVGVNTLHADASANDESDDFKQPSTMTWWYAEDPIFQENVNYDPTNVQNNKFKFKNILTVGYTEPYFDEILTGTKDSGDPFNPSQDFAHLKKSPTSVGDAVNDNSSAGYKVSGTYGPYKLDPGESVTFVQAEVISGLGQRAAYYIGHRYRDIWLKGGDDYADISYDANHNGSIDSGEKMDKNEWIMTGRDSLLHDMQRAKANYDSGYNIPKGPRPPSKFAVQSAQDRIQLSWELYDGQASKVTGFEIYRGRGQYEGDIEKTPPYTYDKIADLGASARSYGDDDVVRGTNYFYYIQAVGKVNNDGTGMTPTGVRLKSNRYYTQTYNKARLARGAGTLSEARVVPNPLNTASDESVRFDEPRRLGFLNIPPQARIQIFTERGDLVDTIMHTDNSGDEYWTVASKARQPVVSGVYLAVIKDLNTGDQRILQFSIIR